MALSLVTMRDFHVHGPIFEVTPVKRDALHSDNVTAAARTRVQPELACVRRAGSPWHAFMRGRNITMHAVDAVVVWNLELKCRLLWASFQFTPRSWMSSVLLRNCSARTWTHTVFERWIGEKQSRFHSREQSDRKFGITFGAGRNKTLVYNDDTTFNLISPPSTEAPVESCSPDGCDTGAWASVATHHSYSCACLFISPSPCVCCSLSARLSSY